MRTFLVTYDDAKGVKRQTEIKAANKYRVNKQVYLLVGRKTWIYSVVEVEAAE